MKNIISAGIVMLAAAMTLTACGGGGSDSSSSGSSDSSSYWTMDSHNYVNGGYSAVSTSSSTGTLVTTAVVSTATLNGGDNSNGAYSGSALTFAFKGSPVDGIYTVVPDRASFVAADVATAPILVDVMVGVAVNTGSTQYTASSGKVYVTRDTSGGYHFSSVAAIPAAKTVDVLGGVAGAPTSMALTIVDAY
jgi:hypothetical protein